MSAAADGTFTNLEAVVSLDVGTARSGFAYAISNDHIKVEEEFDGLMVGCGKLPTVICTDRHGRFVSFGQQAIDHYFDPQSVVANLAIFINFKMLLYQHAAAKEWQREDALSTDAAPQPTRAQAPDRVMATSLDGKTQVRVLNLMSYTLLALVQHARRRLSRLGKSPSQSNVRWVITVPAIWSPAAKDLMRVAALDAGFVASENQLRLCLESDAAALAIQPVSGFDVGTRLLVADLGGGTADFTAQEIKEKRAMMTKDVLSFGDGRATERHTLAEILASSGGAWGSTYIDQHFLRMLDATFGEAYMTGYREAYPHDWYGMLQGFEALKHKEFGMMKSEGVVPLRMPRSFSYHLKNVSGEASAKQLCERYSTKKAESASATTPYKVSYWPSSFLPSFSAPAAAAKTEEPAVVWKDATEIHEAFLYMSRKEFNSYAQPIVQRTVAHAHAMYLELQKQGKAPHHVVLAGGLGECKPMMDAFAEWISKLSEDVQKRPRLHCPGRAAVSVLSGAVRDGLGTCAISSRVMPWHYAYCSAQDVGEQSYAELMAMFAERTAVIERFRYDGKIYHTFMNILHWLTERGKSYPVDHIEHVSVGPSYDGQKVASMWLYKCQRREGMIFSTSDATNIQRLGDFDIPLPDSSRTPTVERHIDVYFLFSAAAFHGAGRERPPGGVEGTVVRPWGDGQELRRQFTRATFKYESGEGPLDITKEPMGGKHDLPEPRRRAPTTYRVVLLTGARSSKLDACPLELQMLHSADRHLFTAGEVDGVRTMFMHKISLPTYCLVIAPQLREIAAFYISEPGHEMMPIASSGLFRHATSPTLSFCLS